MLPVRQAGREVNATDVEHIGAMTVGGLLLLKGLLKGGPLGLIYKLGGVALIYRGQQGYRPLYDALGITMPAGPTGVGKVNARVEHEIVIERPREDLYRIWRNLENLPIFMENLISVHEVDDLRSIWVAKAPVGTVIKWDAEIINDVPNELIAWQTLEGSGVDIAGSVHFDALENGSTRIRVIFRYDPPADALGIWLAKATGRDPQREIEDDLARFKAIMEIGGAISKPKPKRATVR